MTSPLIQLEPLGGVKQQRITVGSTAVQIALTTNRATRSVCIQPSTTNTGVIYIGDSTVTTGNGWALTSPLSLDLNLALGNLYAISLLAGQAVDVLTIFDEDGQ